MAITKEERAALQAELAKKQARESESDEQKWIRAAVKDEMRELLEEMFPSDDGDGDDSKPKPKPSGVQGLFDNLLGSKTA